ncbi:PA14 domain protein [Phycisphaerae bacterium RAS1]|nr:PA14 domain protein [Phycisphaerae bacterium RAS1]
MIAVMLFVLADVLPLVVVDHDDFLIERSCRVTFASASLIDADGDGVIRVTKPDVTIEFEPGAVLSGDANVPDDQRRGCGIRVDGKSGVTVRGARVRAYACGIWASGADGLTLEDCDASSNRRDRLKSTPMAEDAGDWLWPHDNDTGQWRTKYGAGVCIESSRDVTVRGCRVNGGQNGLILDRVENARVYDNDFSFNSGWGLALWRTSRCVITRNAMNFCIRGYSDGVYNRGQDSAGILMFEQCCENTIAENSATHCGDGLFAFAGREALGESGEHPPEWHRRRGCNGNLIINNDFSYAAAHGLELTFSFDNRIIGNRLVGNCICGIWGGYSQDTLISGNEISCNGDRGYGAERGGVNIEHGRRNSIVSNRFFGNACGVHLWWDADEGIAARPWAKENGVASDGNLVAGNRFEGGLLGLHLRGSQKLRLAANEFVNVVRQSDVDAVAEFQTQDSWQAPEPATPAYSVLGEKQPRAEAAKVAACDVSPRRRMIITEWGPWNGTDRMAQVIAESGNCTTLRLLGCSEIPEVTVTGGRGVSAKPRLEDGFALVDACFPPGWSDAVFRFKAGREEWSIALQRLVVDWNAIFFLWTEDADPREKLAQWRDLARSPAAVRTAIRGGLTLPFGHGGPGSLKPRLDLGDAKLAADRFGCIAETRVRLDAGAWRVRTRSDDGVRVIVDGRPVVENWTWHVPTVDTGEFELSGAKDVQIVVEYFEIDGYATLEFELAPVRGRD